MKIEFGIPEEEINKSITAAARDLAVSMFRNWQFSDQVKKKVMEKWQPAIDKIVYEELAKLPEVRKMVRAEIEKKVRSQLNKVLKAAE